MNSTLSYQNIWRVSLPIIFSFVAENIVNVTDTAFLGRVGIVELGAAGNAGILFIVLLELGLGFGIGNQIIIGRRNGEKNYHQIGEIIHNAFLFLIPLSFLLFILIQWLSPYFLELFTASDAVLMASIDYLSIRSYGILFAFINFIYISFYTGITSTRILSQATLIQAGVNVLVDYLLIFGNFGFPELGIKGAALASVFAEIAALLFYVIHTRKKIDHQKYKLFQNINLKPVLLKKMLKLSSPIMFQYFVALSAWLIFFMIIEQIGELELAASHIVRSIYMVLMIPLFGFSSATSTLVSNLIGENRSADVIRLSKRIVLLSLSCTLSLVPFILIFPDYCLRIYTEQSNLIEAARPILYVISASMLFFCIAYISFSTVTGTGKTFTALLIELSSILIYLIGAYWFGVYLDLALPLVWCTEFIYFGIMGGLSILYLKYGKWQISNI